MDKHIKRIMEMSSYNPKIGKKRLNEQDINQTQQQGSEESGLDSQNFESSLEQALTQVINDLPNELQNVGDKDGQLEPLSEMYKDGSMNEAIGGLIAGTLLALPALTSIIGKVISYSGKKADSQTIQSAGEKVKEFADKWHHKYIHLVEKMITPFTKDMDEKTRSAVAKGVFYTLVAVLGANGLVGAAKALNVGNIALASVESGLTSVKVSELVSAAKEALPTILAQIAK